MNVLLISMSIWVFFRLSNFGLNPKNKKMCWLNVIVSLCVYFCLVHSVFLRLHYDSDQDKLLAENVMIANNFGFNFGGVEICNQELKLLFGLILFLFSSCIGLLLLLYLQMDPSLTQKQVGRGGVVCLLCQLNKMKKVIRFIMFYNGNFNSSSL